MNEREVENQDVLKSYMNIFRRLCQKCDLATLF